jgi:hypothetical protein
MANIEDQPTKDSQRALPRNRRMRGVTHQPDSTPRVKSKSNEAKRAAERQAGQRDMFDDPIPEVEFRYYQPFLVGLLHFVDLARNVVSTNRQKMVHGAA